MGRCSQGPRQTRAIQKFKNTEEPSEQIALVKDRGQTRPANWPKESVTEGFRGYNWTSMDGEKVWKV